MTERTGAMNIAVIGLGLIGGSLAKSTKAKTSHQVLGFDLDRETMTLARLSGAIDGALTDENLPEQELILIALRPAATIEWVREHGGRISSSATVVDMCGVKRAVVGELSVLAEMHGFTYIGGHPMAGKERGGFVNSSAELFDGADMILTPDEKAGVKTLEMLKDFFLDLGFAALTFSKPDEHDRIIAYTSQLAHICSSAYVKSPDALLRRGFSAGSFRDMTRVALLDEDMWTELFLDNEDYLLSQLDIYISHLQEYRAAVADSDAPALKALLKDGREKKSLSGGA